MKKFGLILIAAAIMVGACSCAAKKPAPVSSVADSMKQAYDVETVKYDEIKKEGIDINYPQIKGWSNADAQAKWNDTLKNAMIPTGDDIRIEDMTDYQTNFEIKEKSDSLLSILITGSQYFEGAAHPYAFAYTYNIDMNTGKSVRLVGLSDDELGSIADKLLKNDFKIIGAAADYGIKIGDILPYNDVKETKEDIVTMLKGFDNDDEGSFPTGYSYFSENKVGLILSVNHAMGDYIILEVER